MFLKLSLVKTTMDLKLLMKNSHFIIVSIDLLIKYARLRLKYMRNKGHKDLPNPSFRATQIESSINKRVSLY